jgi:DNA repair protein RecO (recombination protein O)
MVRSLTYNALVLRVRPSGESNRDAYFLTAEEGILRATVFGGPKSRLRAQVSPFHRGTLWIYRDPVKDSRKVTDFDVRSWRPGIRELYERATAAGAVAETILAGHGGGGNWTGAFALAEGALDSLENADEAACRRVLVRFFWDWAELLGLRPELNRCASCDANRAAGAGASGKACEAAADGVLWYSQREGVMLCSSCAEADYGVSLKDGPARSGEWGGLLPVGPGARRWLAADPALQAVPDEGSLRQAKALATAVLAAGFGKRLPTWEYN